MHPEDIELTEAIHIARMRPGQRARAFALGREAAVARMLEQGLCVTAARDWATLRDQRMRDLVAAFDIVSGRVLPGHHGAR